MSVVGQLFITPQTGLSQYLDQRFGGDGDAERLAAGNKPWLLVHRSGKTPRGWFNPLYPPVQDWVADVFAGAGRSLQGFARLQGTGHAAHGLAILLVAGDPLDPLRV